MSKRRFFKTIRILFLLFVLLIVGGDYYLTKLRTTDWDLPLQMVIYPINGDSSQVVDDYISQLTVDTFKPIEAFMQGEASAFKLTLTQPVYVVLGDPVKQLPPKPPEERNVLNVMWWSLKMRYWAHEMDTYQGPASDIRMFIVYYDPTSQQHLSHSLGLQKGLVGVVNGYADKKQQAQNNIVITHEMLHTVGATDKYNLENGDPIYPAGFANPDKKPLYPQDLAEIMAGVIPTSEDRWRRPTGFDQVVIGFDTAEEINWKTPKH